jgi:hypothetical protein
VVVGRSVADASADAPDAFGVSGVRGFARKRPAGFFFADTQKYTLKDRPFFSGLPGAVLSEFVYQRGHSPPQTR